MICLLIADLGLSLALRGLHVAWLVELFQPTGSDQPPLLELRPGARLMYRGFFGRLPATLIQIGPQGLRDPGLTIPKPPGIQRVACVGDSYTMGLGVEQDQAFPAQLERVLRSSGRPEIEVLNAGVAAYNMYDYPRFIEQRVLGFEPDLIVLQICGNDADDPAGSYSTLRWALVRLARWSGLAKAALALHNERRDLELYLESLRRTLALCRGRGLPLLVWPQSLPEGAEQQTRELCGSLGARLLDLDGFAPQTLPDDPHYTAQSYAELARIALPQLLPYLERATDSDQGAP